MPVWLPGIAENPMSINNISGNLPVQQVTSNPTLRSVPATNAEAPTAATDRLTLSGASHLLAALKSNDGVRTDKVASIKTQIADGSYETDDKLNGAIDTLLDELNK